MKKFNSTIIPVAEVCIGDTLNMLTGYTITITNIEIMKEPFITPRYIFTFYTNIDDDRKPFKKSYPFNEYVTLIEFID